MSGDFTQLKDLMLKAAGKYGMQREVRAALIRDRARQAIRAVWGDEVTEIRPLYFKNSVLTVEVDDSAWGREVFLKKEELIRLVESEGGLKNCIKDIRTKVVG